MSYKHYGWRSRSNKLVKRGYKRSDVLKAFQTNFMGVKVGQMNLFPYSVAVKKIGCKIRSNENGLVDFK